MSDIALAAGEGVLFDLALDGADLATDGGLESAVIISLFTDRRAEEDDTPPGDDDHRRGWWADGWPEVEGDQVGSRLWLLARSKTTADIPERAREYGEAALRWLIDDGVADSVNVEATRTSNNELMLNISIQRGTGSRYQQTWEYQLNGV